ncbi:MAG TPA: META domain-containing protein [Vicinamibacteria bacterium]|nr:META domain-containing protein [Vicinamibacteria bacterium]HRB11469.1 META domain-containing protein [Vicinamibacteria bacterium]
MIKNRILLSFVFAASILASGCGEDVLTGPTAVTGGVWKLQSLETPALFVPVGRPESYTVEFRDAAVLAVKADCNSCSGTYTISGSSLTIGALACTRAFCGEASLDTAFLAVLTNASSFGVTDAELKIFSSKGTARLNR